MTTGGVYTGTVSPVVEHLRDDGSAVSPDKSGVLCLPDVKFPFGILQYVGPEH
jgi:hypothetical protein